ncbi:MAG: flavin reductase [Thermoplasmata archaeon]|nr:flavin reductase [Candidatus Sysuiplasma jiujiangense]
MPADERAFRRMISSFPTGVAVIAASDGESRAGMTANALLSLSLKPPSVVISLQNEAETTRLVEKVGRAGISFLAHDQKHVSEIFSRRNSQELKFSSVRTHSGRFGQPLVDGCLGAIEIAVERIVEASDHRLVLGNVLEIENLNEKPPLIYFASGYAAYSEDGRFRLPSFRH